MIHHSELYDVPVILSNHFAKIFDDSFVKYISIYTQYE